MPATKSNRYCKRTQSPDLPQSRPMMLTGLGERRVRQLLKRGASLGEISATLELSKHVLRGELARLKLLTHGQKAYRPVEAVSNRFVEQRKIGGRSRSELSKAGIKHIRPLLKRGVPHAVIAQEIGVSETAFEKILKRAVGRGLFVADGKSVESLDPALKKEIFVEFLSLTTIKEIARRLRCKESVVSHVIRQVYGLPTERIRYALKRLTEADRKKIQKDPEAFFTDVSTRVEKLWSQGHRPSYQKLLRKGIPASQYSLAILLWRVKYPRSSEELRKGPKTIDSIQALKPFIDSALHDLPNTPSADPTLEPQDVNYKRCVAYVCQIDNDRLRNLLALQLLIQTTQLESWYAYYTHSSGFYRNLRRLVDYYGEQKVFDYSGLEDILFTLTRTPKSTVLSHYAKYRFIGEYRSAANRVYDYLSGLNEEKRVSLAKYLLLDISAMQRIRHVQWDKEIRDLAQQKRKAASDVVHENYYKLRFAASLRLNAARRFRNAVRKALEQFEKDKVNWNAFSYIETATDDNQRQVKQEVTFELWSPAKLAFEAGETYGKPNRSIKVRFVGVRALDSEQNAVEPWWVEFYRSRVTSEANGAIGRHEFNKRWGYPESLRWDFPIQFSGNDGRQTFQLAKLLQRGMLFVDVERLYLASLVGTLVVQLGTKTGMRVGEMQQISATRDCIIEISGLAGKKLPSYAVMVTPKGRKKPEIKYIDPECWKLIVELTKFNSVDQGLDRLPKVNIEISKAGIHPNRYIFQFRRNGLDSCAINQCLRFVSHGAVVDGITGSAIPLSVHTIRHAFAAELQQQGVPLELIQKLLSHKRIEPTEYYSEPPLHRVRAAVEQIFVDRLTLRVDQLRKPEEVKRMLDEAQTSVGALTEVLGGTCVVGSMCPAKFVCIGCAGNAPDPRKRSQIETKKEWAEKQLVWSENEKLFAEARQMKKIASDCDSMLKEMDLIDVSERDARETSPVILEKVEI